MGKTALVLIAALILVPLLAFQFDRPLTPEQWRLLSTVTWTMLGVAALCFVLGELTGNYSQVDKIWSIAPPLYAWIATMQGGMDARMVLMSVLATIWGLRLTYNFSRHGAYTWKFWSGAEDYRWAHVRQNPHLRGHLRFGLFNLFFISLYQNALLLLIALPILVAHRPQRALDWPDYILATIFIGLVLMETLADQQQRRFQDEKRRRIGAGEALSGAHARGFVAEGLWSRSRHPNYFAEQSIWVVFFLFSVAATGRLNWSIAGCLLLVLLFQGSSKLAEEISSKKYPEYTRYQRTVPRFIPRLFKG